LILNGIKIGRRKEGQRKPVEKLIGNE